ncbi:MAG TPA: metalloregulator ArsR/SmtB family transcription factor, partial [Actinomycetes bacterium]|nr:metalloregulator ArsR/SmtB family transcription factor [Actinomycetes bacterium]
ALGDPTRLRILGLLQAEGELSAGELTRRLAQPQPKVSNHLACLRWCGFVATRRDHRVVYYRLADDRVAAMLELARGLLADNADHVAACCRIAKS